MSSFLPKQFEEKLIYFTGKLSGNKYLNALKDGFAYAMPFIIVGALVLALVNLPFTSKDSGLYWGWYADLMAAYKGKLVQPFYVTMGVLSLYVSFGIGYSLSQYMNVSMEEDVRLAPVTGGFLSLFSFLMLSGPSDWMPLAIEIFGLKEGNWLPVIDARFLDAKGLFTAIISSFFTINVYKYMMEKKIVFRLPASVPPALGKSFEIILPVFVLSIILQAVNIIVANYDTYTLPNLIMTVIGTPLMGATDNLFSVLVVLFIIHFLWFFGLHGANIVMAVITPVLLTNLQVNIDAVQVGLEPTTFFTAGFLEYFAYAGGSGATLGLCILYLRSQSTALKQIGGMSIGPGIFNINEPIVFGSPIVGNPILGIPFIFVPMINATIAWFALKLEIIPKLTSLAPWTAPAPIGALIATQSFAALVVSCLLIVLSVVLYYPFFKMYEKTMVEKEQA